MNKSTEDFYDLYNREITLEEVIAEVPINVRNGADWLDKVMPGWDKKIDLDSLDINSCIDCVLGQLLGHYSGDSDLHEQAYEHDQEFGFCTYPQDYLEKNDIWNSDPIMEHLTLAWEKLIEERR